MGDAGGAAGFITGTGFVPDLRDDDGGAVIFFNEDFQSVGEPVFMHITDGDDVAGFFHIG